MDQFIEYIKRAFAWLKNIAQRIIRGIMNFFRDVVGWFQSLNLNQQKHTPFLLNGNSPQFREMIANAPVKDVGLFSKNEVIFQGVYDSDTEEIVHSELLGADTLDNETRNVIGNESCVVLN